MSDQNAGVSQIRRLALELAVQVASAVNEPFQDTVERAEAFATFLGRHDSRVPREGTPNTN